MKVADAVAFLAPAVPRGPGTWADFGAGRGTFTEALAALLGPDGCVIAVDVDPESVRALEQLRDLGSASLAAVVAVHGDFRKLEEIRELRPGELDGALFANALHFVPDAADVVRRTSRYIRPGGRLVVVEYERSVPNPWVPHPLPPEVLRAMTAEAGFGPAEVVARRPSRYHRRMYCAVAARGFSAVPPGM